MTISSSLVSTASCSDACELTNGCFACAGKAPLPERKFKRFCTSPAKLVTRVVDCPLTDYASKYGIHNTKISATRRSLRRLGVRLPHFAIEAIRESQLRWAGTVQGRDFVSAFFHSFFRSWVRSKLNPSFRTGVSFERSTSTAAKFSSAGM